MMLMRREAVQGLALMGIGSPVSTQFLVASKMRVRDTKDCEWMPSEGFCWAMT
jgi:hypothetical protein